MENQIIVFEQKKADIIAEDYFTAMCGFNRPGERFKSMLLDGLAIRDKMTGSFQIRSIVSSFGREAICGGAILISDFKFACNALEQIDQNSVIQIYAYILTAGNIDFESSSVLDLFYADIWGTAYVDAGRDLLREWIQNKLRLDEEIFVSDSFGPGYYGMDMTQLPYFFQLLDADKIGVQLNGSTMMLPLKSCAGFFVTVRGPGQLPGEACKSCLAGTKGCNFCRSKTQERRDQKICR